MNQVIENLQQIRHFAGHAGKFWPAFLELATRLAKARAGVLLIQSNGSRKWKILTSWPADESSLLQNPQMVLEIEQASQAAVTNNCGWDSRRTAGSNGDSLILLGQRLEADEVNQSYAAVFLLDGVNEETIEQTATQLRLMTDTPAIYQRGRMARQAMVDVVQFSDAMDLMVLLNGEKRYMAAVMTFVNETASRYRCTRASLGWLDSGYIRLQAISHMERFEKKMDIVQLLETAMEEAFDQDEEILWPQPGKSTAVVRDHEGYAREQGIQFILSLPIRLDGDSVGVVTCERNKEPFMEREVQGMRILCDQAARRLGDLRERDCWLGARIKESIRKRASRILGVEYTLAKCISLIVCIALTFLLFGTMSYRVEAPFILRSDDVRYLPAPFEGYIDEAHVEIGEQVEEGDLLLTLDTGDLLLEESAAIANQIRYSREAEKARADNALADMKIALALAEQAKAQLDLVRYHLGRAEVRAPFSGVVVEGDLEELQGAAVKKGDILFKISRIEKMFVELEVSERDIHELAEGMSGEMAFVSQPQLKYPIQVSRIDPVALAKEEGNVFVVRGIFSEEMADWWRPGMSGIAKMNAGNRNVLWIVTHRTVEFFRILLWW